MRQGRVSLWKSGQNEPSRCSHLKSSKANPICQSCPIIRNKAVLRPSSPLLALWPWPDEPLNGPLLIQMLYRKHSAQVLSKHTSPLRSKQPLPPLNSSHFAPVLAPYPILGVVQWLLQQYPWFKRVHLIPSTQRQRQFKPMLATELPSSVATLHRFATAMYCFNRGSALLLVKFKMSFLRWLPRPRRTLNSTLQQSKQLET